MPEILELLTDRIKTPIGEFMTAADRDGNLRAAVEAILAHLVPGSRPGPRGKLPLAVELTLCRAIDAFGMSNGKASLAWPLLDPRRARG